MYRSLSRLLCLLFALTGAAWSQESPQLDLPRVTLSAGMHLIHAQVAANHQQRAIGLMYRKEMPTS
jgi:hypothetical protein